MNTDSLFRTKHCEHLSFCLRILEARDIIASIVDFIVSEDFLFHVKEHFSEERKDVMY